MDSFLVYSSPNDFFYQNVLQWKLVLFILDAVNSLKMFADVRYGVLLAMEKFPKSILIYFVYGIVAGTCVFLTDPELFFFSIALSLRRTISIERFQLCSWQTGCE